MNYRTTRIYVLSLEVVDLVAGAVAGMPSGLGFLADQLRRAAASITLNFVEGCGRSSTADRIRFFTMAIGSAHEVAGAFEVMHRFKALTAEDLSTAHDHCDHLIAMLRKFT